MMKIFKFTIFALAWVAGVSVSALAQNDQRDPPPKKDPPVVVVKEREKEKPREKPREDNRGNEEKPGKPEAYSDTVSDFLK